MFRGWIAIDHALLWDGRGQEKPGSSNGVSQHDECALYASAKILSLHKLRLMGATSLALAHEIMAMQTPQ